MRQQETLKDPPQATARVCCGMWPESRTYRLLKTYNRPLPNTWKTFCVFLQI